MPSYLLHVENRKSRLSTLLSNPVMQERMNALCCVDLGPEYQTFLLCFSKFAIYITYDGERARQSEIMWPTQDRLKNHDVPYIVQKASAFIINLEV